MLNQDSMSDEAQHEKNISDMIDDGEQRTELELESVLLREIMTEQESLVRTRSN